MRIRTRKKHARLTNLDISTHYRHIKVWLFPGDILSALAYWIVYQNPNKKLVDLNPVLKAYSKKIMPLFKDFSTHLMHEFTYDKLDSLLCEKNFEKIPEIMALNRMKPDFIDLCALSRNVFYMLLRNKIIE